MPQGDPSPPPTLANRFTAFVIERFPFASAAAAAAFSAAGGATDGDQAAIEMLRGRMAPELRGRVAGLIPAGASETTPGVAAEDRVGSATKELLEACDGFLRRAALRASLTSDERREILRGMMLTRATDNRLKAFFAGGDVRYGEAAFQGKGFRSLGQEAIYAAGLRLRRGDTFRG
ncbi:MAG: hypothetical protein H0U19_09900, partial [Acidobacteria bacterium]|nr:hypothetical protein [Acidobacteriota bacterium]